MRIDFIYCKVEYLSRLITVESQGNLTNIDFVFQNCSYFLNYLPLTLIPFEQFSTFFTVETSKHTQSCTDLDEH